MVLDVVTIGICPNCGSDEHRFSHVCIDHQGMTNVQLPYHRCRNCGVLFLRRRFTGGSLEQLYGGSYAPFTTRQPSLPAGRGRLGRRLQALYSPEDKCSLLLDFGCGDGGFLDAAREVGWRTIGLDFAPTALERTRARGHDVLDAGSLSDGVGAGSVDLIRMNHVLEHLTDPVRVVSVLREKLAPGGILHVAVPNPDGISAMCFKSSWWASEPRHVVLYGPEPLKRLLIDAGFREVEIISEPSVRDFTRSFGIRLRRDPESLSPGRLRTRVLSAGLLSISALGLGDRLHAFAQ